MNKFLRVVPRPRRNGRHNSYPRKARGMTERKSRKRGCKYKESQQGVI